jgi:hypothetical protein
MDYSKAKKVERDPVKLTKQPVSLSCVLLFLRR